jgi:hypothetical protein
LLLLLVLLLLSLLLLDVVVVDVQYKPLDVGGTRRRHALAAVQAAHPPLHVVGADDAAVHAVRRETEKE